MKSKRQHSKESVGRQRAVYTAPSGKAYKAKVKQLDRKDRTVRIEFEYVPGKWLPAWVSFSDVEAAK